VSERNGIIISFNSSKPLPAFPLTVVRRNPPVPSYPSLTHIRAHRRLDFRAGRAARGRGHEGLEIGKAGSGPGLRFLTARRRNAGVVTGKVGIDAIRRQRTAVGRVVGRGILSESGRRLGCLLAVEDTLAC